MTKKLLKVNDKYITRDGKPIVVNLENEYDINSYENIVDEQTGYATQNNNLADEIEYLLVNGLIDGSPKGVYDNLSALQTAYPNGAIGVYLTKDNGHWYYWNSEAWVDGGVYQKGSESGSGDPTIVDSALSTTSENPVQNKVITEVLNSKANYSDVYTQTETNKLLADFEVSIHNNFYDKTQVDSLIGNINTILDNINGEVI